MTKIAAMFLVLAAVAGSVLHVTLPAVAPPVDAGIHNSITSFVTDHPEWRLLQSPRIDTTPIRFEHYVHMNPQTPQMQKRLEAWVKQQIDAGVAMENIPVTRRFENGGHVLELTCAACHQTDTAGAYMQSIRFESHCVQCHELGNREGEPVPHGSGLKTFVERIAGVKQVNATKPVPPAAARGPASGPRRGPGGPPAAASQKEEARKTADEFAAELKARFEDDKDKLYRALGASCAKCHGLTDHPSNIVAPRIPDRWLPRSFFGHAAHQSVACVECHTQAGDTTPRNVRYPGDRDPDSAASRLRWTGRTRDIMLPDIDSCRACHQPDVGTTRGARHDCVMCHTFHGKAGDQTRSASPASPQSIRQFLKVERQPDE